VVEPNEAEPERPANRVRETGRRIVLGLGFAVLFLTMWWRCG
jgi:hypothetical protein